jgi:uncharacterized membrane protein
MIAGFGTSLVVFAVGAILDFAVTVSPDEHGFNLNTIGVILMILGAVGAAVALIAYFASGSGWRRHRTVVDDGRGNVVRRDDTYA